MVDPPGLVTLQVVPERLPVLLDDLPECDGDEHPELVLRDDVIGVHAGDPRAGDPGDALVVGDAEPDRAEGRSRLPSGEEDRVPADPIQDLIQAVLSLLSRRLRLRGRLLLAVSDDGLDLEPEGLGEQQLGGEGGDLLGDTDVDLVVGLGDIRLPPEPVPDRLPPSGGPDLGTARAAAVEPSEGGGIPAVPDRADAHPGVAGGVTGRGPRGLRLRERHVDLSRGSR